MFNLTGKKALITGSTQGIGFAVAKILSEHGAKTFISGRESEEKLLKASSMIPGSTGILANLGDSDCAEKMYAVSGDVDILVLNASVQVRRPWDEITDEDFDLQISVNLKSSLKLLQKYVPHMKEQKWGRIVIVGSVQQEKPHKDMLVYSAIKSALLNITCNLAKQLAPYGITVNNVAPGVILTPRNDEALSDSNYKNAVLSNIPSGFMGESEDCATQILLLCSDEGRYITGADIFIDGGMKL